MKYRKYMAFIITTMVVLPVSIIVFFQVQSHNMPFNWIYVFIPLPILFTWIAAREKSN
jgi:hypothetical protein